MIDANGFVVAKNQRKIDRSTAFKGLKLKPILWFKDIELACVPAGSRFVLDTECYRNFWYCALREVSTGRVVGFEHSANQELHFAKLRWMLWRFELVTFNGMTYDMPMIALALKGATCSELKDASDFIIKSGINYGTKKVTNWDFQERYKLKVEQYNHIDLFNVCPVNGGVTGKPASLKLYGGRIHCPRMQDLPIQEDKVLTEEEAEVIKAYCPNDLETTVLLLKELLPSIELREKMSEQYKVDLRSKSDAQVAEAVICSELQKVLGYYPGKPNQINESARLTYNVPDWIKFQTPSLQRVLEVVRDTEFQLDGQGAPIMPDSMEHLEIRIGTTTYKLGMGGLHSNEKKVTHLATDDIILADNDFESFYPKIILNQGLFPPHLKSAFLAVYKSIVDRRLQAKKDGDKTTADSLKITINGSFGKLGNKYSRLYAPQLMLQVTISGQLILLMLIEMMELAGIEVISGNTDGFISKYKKQDHPKVRQIIKYFEELSNLKTEETRYGGVYSRDVNNYIATKLKQDKETKEWTNEIEECKVKGVFSEKGSALNSPLSKNPEALICSEAVQAFIKNKTPIDKTIRECKDVRKFISVKNVDGGGEKNGKFLGKVVRWYYAENEAGAIRYVRSGNKVAKTDGAKPCMDLPEEFPTDINYEYYIKETTDIFYDIGLFKKAETGKLFF